MTHPAISHPATSHSATLLVVAKRPAPGQTKTRLTPPLTPTQAAALYECFLRDTLALMQEATTLSHTSATPIQPVIAYLPAGEEGYFRRLAPTFERLLQTGNDLGERLDNALTHYLQTGSQRAVIMDSDSPTLPVAYLAQAFAALDRADVVLGPCEDGGYYLIGLKQPAPPLLRQVQMSTPNVLRDTLDLAAAAGLSVELLPTWYDIDTAEELRRLMEELGKDGAEGANHTRAWLENQARLPL